jgi:hypothetical protein
MAVLAVEQLQHEWAQEQRAGRRVLRLFRGSSGSCATAVGHDPLYHRPGDVEKFGAPIVRSQARLNIVFQACRASARRAVFGLRLTESEVSAIR